MVAQYAADHGFEAIATTLTVSPYQDSDAVRAAGVASLPCGSGANRLKGVD
jgi:predicted adenine nucleotide alpha hydrolase (AANH) superfamily ATPase